MIPEYWTQDAINCYNNNCMCCICDLFHKYSYLRNNCKMKNAVKQLISFHGKPKHNFQLRTEK